MPLLRVPADPSIVEKSGAWVLLAVIGYGFVRCNLQLMQGLDKFE